MERINVALSICFASNGIVSLRRIPGTFDLIGLNSPRTLDGASGLGSQMSIWLGPPWRNTRITDFALPQPCFALAASGAVLAAACSRRMSARLMPMIPAPPTRRNSRRLNPSHVLPGFPGIEIIVFLSVKQKRGAVDQRPRYVLRYFESRSLAQVNRRELFLGRQTVQACQINLLQHLFVVTVGFDNFRNAAVTLVDGIADGHAVDHAQRVRQRNV